MEAPAPSALSEAAVRVGDRWTLLIVEVLLGGPKRFSELAEEVRGIAPNILSQRLKHLERERVLVGRPYSERPPRMAYELTAPGRKLAGALRLLAQWGAGASEEAQAPRHAACDTPMEARWYCPTCAHPVEEDDQTDLRFV